MTALALAACFGEQTEPQDLSAARRVVDQLPPGYFDTPPPPSPEPEQAPAPPLPPVAVVPAPAPVPPSPPPPPPIDTGALERAALAEALLAERRQAGPRIVRLEDAPPEIAPEPSLAQDHDYSRDETPKVESGLPVDRRRILTQDRVITASLLTPINSQLPGYVRAVVDSHVFGADGRLVLVPKGTVMIGKYLPLEKQGESRLNVVWFRLIRPDGAHILNVTEPDLIATDLMGRTGLVGEVDNRLWERYGTALITSLVAAAASLSVPTTNDVGTFSAGANNLSQQLGQVTAKVLEQTINLAPIVSISAGEIVTLAISKDIFLREPPALQTATAS